MSRTGRAPAPTDPYRIASAVQKVGVIYALGALVRAGQAAAA